MGPLLPAGKEVGWDRGSWAVIQPTKGPAHPPGEFVHSTDN